MNWNKKNLLAIVGAMLAVLIIGNIISILNPERRSSPTIPSSEAKETIVQKKQTMEIKIRSGWCLSRIAEGLGTNTEDLVEMNQIADPNLIHANELLKVVPYNRINEVEVSWYGPAFHGKKMANGEIFDMYDPTTVAHKLLPFDKWVKLTRTDNQKSIEVKVRDRGPYIKGRHFDISYAAAEKLGIVDLGVVTCKVEVLY